MNLSEQHSFILKELLHIEHSAIAAKLCLIRDRKTIIDDELLIKSVGMIDELSRFGSERARKIVITAAAILWTYKNANWDGLRDYLILILSRIGFPPSAIMIDSEYDNIANKFKGLSSFLNELNVTVHQLNHEIFIKDTKFLVTGFQKRVWDKLSGLKLVGVSAPTSAGKSFIILLKAIDLILQKEGNIIYIVPTLSLVAQVAADFNEHLKRFQIKNFRIATTYSSDDLKSYKIYILTQEKAISAFSPSECPYKDVRILIVDEIQNIEKVANEDDQRSKILYDTLMEFRHTCNPDLTIISGPRVEGLKQLGIDIFAEQEADEEKANDSPVASITYAISKSGGNYFFNQYTDIIKHHNKIPVTNNEMIQGYGGSQYRDNFISYLSTFINNLGIDSRNIIFSPTPAQAKNTAKKLAELRQPTAINQKIQSLVDFIKTTVHSKYDMCETIPKGFAYHHGKTPTHVRVAVEKAIRDKLIPNIVCTTTLMQGVNLPAQNVILRNPDLAIRRRNGVKPKLTDYEIANLRGRAGRLLKDFIGRTFVLEEDSFERTDQQIELFPEAEKELRSGYGEKYNAFRSEIEIGLQEDIRANESNKEYSFLMTYIRQTILKHSENSIERLNAVGIEIEVPKVLSISQSMDQLQVPKEVCFRNRYWDPLDLDELYKLSNLYQIPTSVSDHNIEQSLYSILYRMQEHFPLYYDRYFNVDKNMLFSCCISAKEWMKEKPLNTILDTPYFDTPEKVDERISLLQNKISYGLPMLLKPLYDLKAPNNMFLRFIEIGAYKPVTRKMIEFNIPREIAIYLCENYFDDFDDNQEDIEDKILAKLRDIINSVGYWYRIQFESIV
jgi:hypothetical protein